MLEALQERDVLVPMLRLGIPDQLVDHASPDESKQSLGLTPPQMVKRISERFASAFGDRLQRQTLSV